MKKVSDTEKRDRSAAAVPGAAATSPSGSTAATASSGPGGGGLADALAQALSARNKKVSASGKSWNLIASLFIPAKLV